MERDAEVIWRCTQEEGRGVFVGGNEETGHLNIL